MRAIPLLLRFTLTGLALAAPAVSCRSDPAEAPATPVSAQDPSTDAPVERPDDAEPTDARPPNIVVLLADDAGFADFGFQPGGAEDLRALTPHIDTLARDGLRLSDFHSAGPVCSPSRAGLLVGRYPQRFGHETNIPPGYMGGGMDLEQRTVFDRLRAHGYHTALIGKWHLGYPPVYWPNERGIDHFFGCLQGARSYLPMMKVPIHKVLQRNGQPTPEEGYVTDRLGQEAVDYIAAHADEPFCLVVSFTAPHGPLEPRPEDAEALAALDFADARRRDYAGLVIAMDDAVGRVLAALDAHDLREDTLVVFTNDNGGQTSTGAVNLPLRGRKGEMYEGGTRVPCAVRWPGRVPAGSHQDDPSTFLDLTPTFLAAAGVEVPDDGSLDGVDLLGRWCGEAEAPAERDLFWRVLGPQGPVCVRRGPWKLIVEERGAPPVLFHLGRDLGETTDVAAAHPELVADLSRSLAAWEATLEAPRWGRVAEDPANEEGR